MPGTILNPRAEASALAFGCWLAGVLAAWCVVVPFSPTAPRTMCAALALAAFVVGTVLHLTRSWVPAWVLHVVLALATVTIGVAVGSSTTPAGPGVTAHGFVWVAVHSAAFHRPRPARRHLALIGLTLAVALRAADAPSPLQTWVFVMVAVGAVAVVLNLKVRALRREASHDGLTGAMTRRSFLRELDRARAHAARRDEPVTLVLVDLDDFKRVNDEGGHGAGDRLLATVVPTWQEHLRSDDLVGRLGGDEFAVLLPGTDAEGAAATLRRMREASPVAWSAGIAEWAGESAEDWVARADDELYAAKARRGRLDDDDRRVPGRLGAGE